MTKANQD